MVSGKEDLKTNCGMDSVISASNMNTYTGKRAGSHHSHLQNHTSTHNFTHTTQGLLFLRKCQTNEEKMDLCAATNYGG